MKLDDIASNKTNRIILIVLKILSLFPILLWPIIFYGSIFIFDDPNANSTYQYFLFYGINAYPIYLIINMVIANRVYPKNSRLATGLYLWPIALLGFLCVYGAILTLIQSN